MQIVLETLDGLQQCADIRNPYIRTVRRPIPVDLGVTGPGDLMCPTAVAWTHREYRYDGKRDAVFGLRVFQEVPVPLIPLEKPEVITKNTLRTSEEWERTVTHPKILDPDGWDRKNFAWSFYAEKITEREFFKRLSMSTCLG